MNNFKNIISNRRKELKMTQRELAEKLNVSDKIISKWETGVSYPDLTIINTLAKVLDISVSELLNVSEKTKTNEGVKVDRNMITKYKMYFMISLGLFLLSVILVPMLSLVSNSNDKNNIGLILILILIFISIIAGIIVFIINNIKFRSLYTEQFYRIAYDKIYYKFSLIFTDIIWIIPFSTIIYISNMGDVYFRGILLAVSYLLILFIKLKIAKQSQYTYKNRTQMVIFLIVSLLSFTSIMVLMTLSLDTIIAFAILYLCFLIPNIILYSFKYQDNTQNN